jgi:capsular exopolysaccharide synthesis family protein
MSNFQNSFPEESKEQELNLKQLFEQYSYYWKWFIFSIIVCLITSLIYLRYADKIYNITAKILLQDENKASGELAGLTELANLAGSGSATAFVLDQIDVMKSRRIFQKVVDQNKLNITYFTKGNVKTSELVESQSPLRLIVLEPNHPRLDSVKYKLNLAKKGNEFVLEDEEFGSRRYSLGQKINSPIGPIMLLPQGVKSFDSEIVINYVPNNIAVDHLLNDVQITPNKEKQSYVVNYSMNSGSITKAELILNSIIDQYNKDVTDDKTRISKATTQFIDSRLDLISKNLSEADSKVADYKDRNNMVDMSSEVQLYMQNASENERKLVEYQTQLRLADMMGSAVNINTGNLLPTNIGLDDQSIQNTVKSYNDLVLEREDLLKSATPDNPIVQNLNKNINELGSALRTSLSNYRQVLQSNVTAVQSQKNKFEGKLNQLPNQERGFKDISREQQIVESLYLFLLQKREETEIQAAATPAILKVIDEAYGSDKPVSPRKGIVLLGALVAGFLIPFGILYLKFLMDNKVHSRKDIEEKFKAPILGEIPASDDPVVKDNDRSSLAEAFRILRTNISFMLGAKKDSAVIFVTSTTSGEGKSFVSTNLSRILAMSGKRALLIGADIRSPKVLDYLGLSHLQHTNIGITQYLINPDMPVDNIIIRKPAPYDFDIIYSGYIAPNPAELLMNGHFKEVIEYGREHYDFVIVDTAPVSLVTDTLLISEFADLTMYVTRANYLDKRLLNVPKELYEDGKLRNMAVVLNDVDFARGYGYVDASSVSLRAKIGKQFRKMFKKKK